MPKKKNYKTVLVSPFKTGIVRFNDILEFYMYKSPCIDSAQSMGTFLDDDAKATYKEMLRVTGLESKFKWQKQPRKGSWKKVDLEDDCIDFEQSRALFEKFNNESELQALLRHVRNSFAHGLVYVWKKKTGNFIMLVDYDSKKHKITAKILISDKILNSWKRVIEKNIKKERGNINSR